MMPLALNHTSDDFRSGSGLFWRVSPSPNYSIAHSLHYRESLTGLVSNHAEILDRLFCHWMIDQLPWGAIEEVKENIVNAFEFHRTREVFDPPPINEAPFEFPVYSTVDRPVFEIVEE